MSYIRVWVHCVWSTKNRQPVLTKEFRYLLHQHIKENAVKKEIFLDRINGYSNHVHCLVSLGSNQTIEKIIQLNKG